MPARPRRIVVVGVGSIGRRHARILAARQGLQVEWCESAPAALELARRELPAPGAVHETFEAALATRPEMMVIATPHSHHADQAIAALRAGIHVLCEKPLSDSLEAARRMVAEAERSAAVFTVGFTLHFHPAIQRIKELIASGRLGSIHHFHAHVGTYQTLVNSKSRFQAALPGALLMDYAHQMDLLLHFLREIPRGVYARGGLGGNLPLRSDPNFAALTCDFEKPMIATIALNYLQSPEQSMLEVIGDAGWVSFDFENAELAIGRLGDPLPVRERVTEERDSWFVAEHGAFLEAIAGRRAPESPARDALFSMQIIDAALRSMRAGQRVGFPR